MATEKKISVASWRLPKKVNFRPWLRNYKAPLKVKQFLSDPTSQ